MYIMPGIVRTQTSEIDDTITQHSSTPCHLIVGKKTSKQHLTKKLTTQYTCTVETSSKRLWLYIGLVMHPTIFNTSVRHFNILI